MFSFQSDLSHQLDDNLGEVEKIPSMELYDLSEENELDTYMSREVPVPEGDEARILTQEELDQGHEYHCRSSHESTCTTCVFLKDIEYV